MKRVIIVGGANGSGKTTFSKKLIKDTKYEFLNADEIEKELENTESSASKLKAGRLFFERLNILMENGQNFILESTLSGNYLVKIIEKLKKKEYNIQMVYVFLDSPDDCIQRVKVRVLKGGHFVPDDDVKRRFFRSKENFWNTYKKLADQWAMFYNKSINGNVIRVAIGNEDNYIVENESLFTTFYKDLKK